MSLEVYIFASTPVSGAQCGPRLQRLTLVSAVIFGALPDEYVKVNERLAQMFGGGAPLFMEVGSV
jgi:hypothetical protein